MASSMEAWRALDIGVSSPHQAVKPSTHRSTRGPNGELTDRESLGPLRLSFLVVKRVSIGQPRLLPQAPLVATRYRPSIAGTGGALCRHSL